MADPLAAESKDPLAQTSSDPLAQQSSDPLAQQSSDPLATATPEQTVTSHTPSALEKGVQEFGQAAQNTGDALNGAIMAGPLGQVGPQAVAGVAATASVVHDVLQNGYNWLTNGTQMSVDDILNHANAVNSDVADALSYHVKDSAEKFGADIANKPFTWLAEQTGKAGDAVIKGSQAVNDQVDKINTDVRKAGLTPVMPDNPVSADLSAMAATATDLLSQGLTMLALHEGVKAGTNLAQKLAKSTETAPNTPANTEVAQTTPEASTTPSPTEPTQLEFGATRQQDLFTKPSEVPADTTGSGMVFHGTSTPITALSDTPALAGGSDANIYGAGLYTTDSLNTANGYTRKGAGGQPTTYQVFGGHGVKLYNLDAPMTPDVRSMVQDSLGSSMELPTHNMDTGQPITSLRDAMDEIRAESQYADLSRQDVQDIFDSIRTNLADQGYRGYTHIGGRATGNTPHTVRIFWNPESDLQIKTGSEIPHQPTEQPTLPLKGGKDNTQGSLFDPYDSAMIEKTWQQASDQRTQELSQSHDSTPLDKPQMPDVQDMTPAQKTFLTSAIAASESIRGHIVGAADMITHLIRDPESYLKMKSLGSMPSTLRSAYMQGANWIIDDKMFHNRTTNDTMKALTEVEFPTLKGKAQADFMAIVRAANQHEMKLVEADPTVKDVTLPATELAKYDPRAVKVYQNLTDLYDSHATMLNDLRQSNGLDPLPHRRGHIRHIWNNVGGNHVVGHFDTEGNLHVAKYPTRWHAQRAIKQHGGQLLNLPKLLQATPENVMYEVLDNYRTHLSHGLDPKEAAKQAMDPQALSKIMKGLSTRTPSKAVQQMFRERRGAQGYTNLDSLKNFIRGTESDIRQTIRSVQGQAHWNEGARIIDRIQSEVEQTGLDRGVAAKMLSDVWNASKGFTSSSPTASFIKKVTYLHALGLWNFIIPILNISFTKAIEIPSILAEMRQAGINEEAINLVKHNLSLSLNAIKSSKAYVEGILNDPKMKRDIQYLYDNGIVEHDTTLSMLEGDVANQHISGYEGKLVRAGKTILNGVSYLERKSTHVAALSGALNALWVGRELKFAGDDLHRFVVRSVNNMVGDYTPGHRARIMYKPFSPSDAAPTTLEHMMTVPFVFTHWVLKQISNMYRAGKLAAVGIYDGVGERRRYWTPAVALTAAVWSFGGLNAFPMVGNTLNHLVNELDQIESAHGRIISEWASWKREHRAAWVGPLTDMSGVDFASSSAFDLPFGIGSDMGFSYGYIQNWVQGFYGLLGQIDEHALNNTFGTASAANKAWKLVPGSVRNRIQAVQALRNKNLYTFLTSKTKAPFKVPRASLELAAVFGTMPPQVEKFFDTILGPAKAIQANSTDDLNKAYAMVDYAGNHGLALDSHLIARVVKDQILANPAQANKVTENSVKNFILKRYIEEYIRSKTGVDLQKLQAAVGPGFNPDTVQYDLQVALGRELPTIAVKQLPGH